MSHFKAKMHQMWFRLGLSPKARWRAYSALQTPSNMIFKGTYFKECPPLRRLKGGDCIGLWSAPTHFFLRIYASDTNRFKFNKWNEDIENLKPVSVSVWQMEYGFSWTPEAHNSVGTRSWSNDSRFSQFVYEFTHFTKSCLFAAAPKLTSGPTTSPTTPTKSTTTSKPTTTPSTVTGRQLCISLSGGSGVKL